MIFQDTLLLEVLKEQFGAHLVKCDLDQFELRTAIRLAPHIGELSSMTHEEYPSHSEFSQSGAIHYNSGVPTFTYTFLTEAHAQLRTILHTELEKKRYKEFSKSFDNQVQSELGQ